MPKLIFILIFSAVFSSGNALASGARESFSEGTKAYLTKDYQQAQENFTKALDLDPHNATILTNLALTEFHLNNKPLAVGLLRKALNYEPSLATAKDALEFILPQLSVTSGARTDSYEVLRAAVLQPVPLPAYLTAIALSFFAAGWTWLNFAGRRKKALEKEEALPPFPLIPSLLSVIFLILLGLGITKIYDLSILRATIITEKAAIQTAPGENQVAILELSGGREVVIREIQGDWLQVTAPGSATGWIKKTSLLMTR